MGNIKDLLRSMEDEEEFSGEEIEVYADSVKQALDLAARELSMDVSLLDYEIARKGTRGFLGVGRQPYRVVVRPSRAPAEYHDVAEIEAKLSKFSDSDLELKKIERDADGDFKIRVTKRGVWFVVIPPRGNGRRPDINEVNTKLFALRVNNADIKKIEKELKRASGKPCRIGEWIPNLENDGSLSVEIGEDEMRAFVHFVPPRFSGRHMEVDDVLDALKNSGVVAGINEKGIAGYLEAMDYGQPLQAAEGTYPRNGKDAYVDYKVRIDKSGISFSEDEKGQVDFKDLDLLENVVVGQLLAVKVPAEEGIPGRTVTNRIIPARSGKDLPIRYGKGTILSEDKMELTAEINGQVVFQAGKISVEPVYFVKGDVSLQTGNIVFLGSIVISGNVQDNFTVKAAGNIEVKGVVQKAFMEAEGDIIVRQGIVGREGAKIESTGGSIYAKFIQTANIIAEKDVMVAEGILHSRVDAGARILCYGRRAKIVGGLIRAGEEVNARYLGGEGSTRTEIRVGINPKVLQQVTDLETVKRSIDEELNKVKLDVNTLTVQKTNAAGKLPADKEELLGKLTQQRQKLLNRQGEIAMELEELKSYLGMIEHKGRICAEKSVFPGVEIYIKDKRFPVKDPYTYIKFSLEGGDLRLSEYEPPVLNEEQQKMMMVRRRR